MRRTLLVANWKCNKTVAEAQAFVAELVKDGALTMARGAVDVVVAPPFTALWPLQAPLRAAGVQSCGQDVYTASHGAYTGAVSAPMVAEAGAGYALVGHSERRSLFGETDEGCRQRLHQACIHGLRPILCVGEGADERAQGRTYEVVQRQLEAALRGLDAAQANAVVLAYEPVWAIGTGKRADVATANEVQRHLRRTFAAAWGERAGAQLRILYGGSVTADGIGELLAAEHVDGALVGGASLKAADFARLIRGARGGGDGAGKHDDGGKNAGGRGHGDGGAGDGGA